MVMTFEAAHTPGPRRGARPRSTGAGIVLVTDRSDRFLKARRHTQLVKILRLALPTVGVAMCVGFVGALMGSGGYGSALPDIPLPRITSQDLSMQNPNYDGVTEDGGTYRVAAERARQDFKATDIIELEGISGDFVGKDKSATKLSATRGTFNHKENVLVLREKIEIRA